MSKEEVETDTQMENEKTSSTTGKSDTNDELSSDSLSSDITLEQALQERDKFLEIAQRSRADFENYQKRASRDLQMERKYAIQPFVGELIPVLDNQDRALKSATTESRNSGIVEGVELVRKQIFDVMGKHGVESIDPTGEKFDPNYHEAILQQPSSECEPMTVLDTAEIGYRLHDRVVRPAKVIVSTQPAVQKEELEDNTTTEEIVQ